MKLTAILAALLALTLAGCGGSHGGPNGPDYVVASNNQNLPAPGTNTTPSTQPLTVQVTNSSSVPIDVVATTPDEQIDLGILNPGDTVSNTLDELPSTVTFSATAQAADQNGNVPAFSDLIVNLGSDYTWTDPFVGLGFQDSSTSGMILSANALARPVFPAVARR